MGAVTVKEIIVTLLFFSGIFFFAVGTIGYIRFPNVFCRLHATTKCDTLGIGLIILGLVIHSFPSYSVVKLLMILTFIWFWNPTAAHIIAKAVYDTEISEGCKQDDNS